MKIRLTHVRMGSVRNCGDPKWTAEELNNARKSIAWVTIVEERQETACLIEFNDVARMTELKSFSGWIGAYPVTEMLMIYIHGSSQYVETVYVKETIDEILKIRDDK